VLAKKERGGSDQSFNRIPTSLLGSPRVGAPLKS